MTARRATVVASAILALGVASCAPAGPTTMVSNRGVARPLPRTELRVISAEEAAHLGLVGRPMAHEFGEGQDGTKLVADLLAEAERQGAQAVGGIGVTLVAPREGATLACRTDILPETVQETRSIPATTQLVPVQKPVQRMVTDYEYRCHTVSEPQTRSVTEYHQECHTVSQPVSRSRTTYSYQYDSFTHSSRSVPHTESYTEYQSRQECRQAPRSTMRTEMVSRNKCQSEPVTHMVTRYEFQYETRYVPPRLETFSHHRLRESEPTCLAPEGPTAAPGANRIDAIFYFPP